jgi:hypothetical protein
VDGTTHLRKEKEAVELEANCDAIFAVPDDLDSGMIMEDALYDPFPALYRSGNIPHQIVVYDVELCHK